MRSLLAYGSGPLFPAMLVGLASLGACSSEGYEPIVLDDTAGSPAALGGAGGEGVGGSGAEDPGGGGEEPGTGGRPPATGGVAPTGGAPAADLPPVTGNCSGWASRYWDCCKPHCAWRANVSGSPTHQCDAGDKLINNGDPDSVQSACNGGPAFMCHSMAPWVSSANANLSYGFAAVTNTGDVCGRCYRLQFDGSSHNGSSAGTQALAGKQMIVQVTNVGGVESGQFDLLIPGGGVGDFNACSTQWGTSDIGAQYGGFLTACQQQLGGNAQQSQYQDCVRDRCESIFGSRFPELYEGCLWYVDWFHAADNPTFVYEATSCPAELTAASALSAQNASGCL